MTKETDVPDSGRDLRTLPIHRRLALAAGAGFQIATTHYHQYNHAFIATIRMPF